MRYDLVPATGLKEVHKVLDAKLKKYDKDAWRVGISWRDLLSNLKEHLEAFELGEDYDEDGNLNIAHVASQALLLAASYKECPWMDDRIMAATKVPRISLDLDDVCLDFLGEYEKRYGAVAGYWQGDYKMLEHLEELKDDKDFWVNLPLLHKPSFEPFCYITSRSIPNEWTMECIQKNGLPCAPVYSVPWNESKVDLLKKLKIDIHVDDKVANYLEATQAGVYCYLMSHAHNEWFTVPVHRRIKDLNLQF